MNSSPLSLTDALTQLTTGLLFLSESEAPLAVISCPRPPGPLPSPALLATLGEPAEAAVQVVTLAYFLRQHIALPGLAGDAIGAARYQALQDFMEQQLAATQVYRVGISPQIHAYALGQLGEQLAGFKTLLIET